MAPRRKKPARYGRKNGPNVEEWVYRFLGNLAAIEASKHRAATVRFARPNYVSQPRSIARSKKLGKYPSRRITSRRRFRPPTPFSWDRVARGAAASSGEEAAPARDSSGSGRDRALLQRINRYTRAGISEGKRRAKRYVQKALSFALERGYLVPADREGKLLRVSCILVKPAARKRQRRRGSRSGGRKSIAGQGDESRRKRQARKRPSGAVALERKTSRGSRGDGTPCSGSPSRSARHHETLSASEVEKRPTTLPAASAARPSSAPDTRGPE